MSRLYRLVAVLFLTAIFTVASASEAHAYVYTEVPFVGLTATSTNFPSGAFVFHALPASGDPTDSSYPSANAMMCGGWGGSFTVGTTCSISIPSMVSGLLYRNGIYNTSVDTVVARFTASPSSFIQNNDFDWATYRFVPLTITNNITDSATLAGDRTYIISGQITINSGVTLTVSPGSIIKFDTATSSSLTVNGTLNAIGEANESESFQNIFFTSLKDDLIAGDTNEDGNTTSASEGDWAGIVINSGGIANFEYSTIRYAGSGTSNAQIYNNGGIVTVSTSTIAHGTDYGLKNVTGTSTVIATDIGFSDYGLYLSGGSASITDGSIIHDNDSYGIYNATSNIVNAEDNWWGYSSGPYHASTNSSGDGNAVTDYVDFSSWISTNHSLIEFCPGSECGSVRSGEIVWTASTTHTSELEDAIFTWNTAIPMITAATSSYHTLFIEDVIRSDKAWKGRWNPGPIPDKIELNNYYLLTQSSNQVQHTIIHELGHALGLGHSYTGNVMYSYQSSQTNLGTQDTIDYSYLWP